MDKGPVLVVKTLVHASAEHAWKTFTDPEAVRQWNAASDDWWCPSAVSDLKNGGSFNYRMEARDGSFGFDFTGHFDEIRYPEFLSYTMDDGRGVTVEFRPAGEGTEVVESFNAETQNPPELQRRGWQAILDRYGSYAEGHPG